MSAGTGQLEIAVQHHQSGRLREAESIYRTILKQQPDHPDALYLLGVVALQVGKADEAARLIERAIAARPGEAEFYNTCGEAYRMLRQYDLAIARYREALALRPAFAGALNNLGNVQRELGRADDAIESYRRAIAADPGFPMSHNNLAVVLKDVGRPEEALAHCRRALEIAPEYADAHTNLGNALGALGRHEEAAAAHEKALAIHPDHAEARSNLGNALSALGRPEEALGHYERVVAARPRSAEAHYNLGIALDELRRPQDAVACYEKAIAIAPEYAEAHHNLGNALDELGRRDDAIAHFERALAIRPDYGEAHRNLSRLRPQRARIAAIEKLLSEQKLTEEQTLHCHFALGNIHQHAESYDRAFEHFLAGNGLKRRRVTFDPESFTAHVDRLVATWSEAAFGTDEAGSSGSELPVFVVGMPRSGTSLVEQILASHPRVHGGGELRCFWQYERTLAARYARSTPYPECVPLHREAIASEFSALYLEELRRHSREALRVTDKMPDNFVRIGLIRTLFPRARIVHCRRNALDTCISNFVHYFAAGNEYSFDLGELGQYYLDYERLMSHWERLLQDDLLTVRYEELVSDQEAVTRNLIDYLDLDWDDRCLEFYDSERAVNPFSSAQVREPIYTRAVDRWKHYRKHLSPLLALLAPESSGTPGAGGAR